MTTFGSHTGYFSSFRDTCASAASDALSWASNAWSRNASTAASAASAAAIADQTAAASGWWSYASGAASSVLNSGYDWGSSNASALACVAGGAVLGTCLYYGYSDWRTMKNDIETGNRVFTELSQRMAAVDVESDAEPELERYAIASAMQEILDGSGPMNAESQAALAFHSEIGGDDTGSLLHLGRDDRRDLGSADAEKIRAARQSLAGRTVLKRIGKARAAEQS